MFIEGSKLSAEKINTIQEFTLRFWKNKLLLNDIAVPLGESTTDILNISNEEIVNMFNVRNEALESLRTFFFSDDEETYEEVLEVQNKFNALLDIILSLPPFKYILPKDSWHTILLDIHNDGPEFVKSISQKSTSVGEILYNFFFKTIVIIDETIAFRDYVRYMLAAYFEKLKKRNEEYYAIGVYSFFTNTELINEIRSTLPPQPSFDITQIVNIGIQFTPTRHPENEKEYILAEQIIFTSMRSFLYYDFFRGVINGHCPRQCHNCGKYFLLLSGHNTCYCSNIAPNQKKKGDTRTCREIGAHIKEGEKKEKRTPAQQEYDKVYNRLKTRKNRGKISTDEWNKLVSEAVSYMEQNQRGELSDYDYREIMSKM